MSKRDATGYSGAERADWTPERSNLQAISTYSERLEERDPELANELRTLHLRSTDMGQVSWLEFQTNSPNKLIHAFRDSSEHLDEAQMEHLSEQLVHTLTMPTREAIQQLTGVYDHAARMGNDFEPENFNALMDKNAQALSIRLETAELFLKEGLRVELLGKTERAEDLHYYLRGRSFPSMSNLTQRMESQAKLMESLPKGSTEHSKLSNEYQDNLTKYENTLDINDEIQTMGIFEAGINEAREAQEQAVSAMTGWVIPSRYYDWELNGEIHALLDERSEALLLAHTSALSEKLSDEAREFQTENPPTMIQMFDHPGYLENFKEFAFTLNKLDRDRLERTISWRALMEKPTVYTDTAPTFPQYDRVASALHEAMKEMD